MHVSLRMPRILVISYLRLQKIKVTQLGILVGGGAFWLGRDERETAPEELVAGGTQRRDQAAYVAAQNSFPATRSQPVKLPLSRH